MTEMEEREIEAAIENMIGAISQVLSETKSAAQRATQPALYDLRAACAYKGITYDSARKVNHLQPLCGYYTHWEDTAQRRKPRWTREQVEPWARVTRPQRIEYVEGLLYGGDEEIAAGALHMLIGDSERGRLPEYLQDVLDEYVETVKGRAV